MPTTDHTEADLQARAPVLLKHLTGQDWDTMNPGTRSKVGTDLVRLLHAVDGVDPARRRLSALTDGLRELHNPGDGPEEDTCSSCHEEWPCRSTKLLDDVEAGLS